MNKRAVVMLGLAAVLAVASVLIARSWLQSQVQPVALVQQIQTTPVVVASSPLYYGNKIRAEHLKVVAWPSSSLPLDTFQSTAEVLGDDKPRSALRVIEAGEPILKSKVSGFGDRASLSALITPSMRATTVRVNDVVGVAGFVLPGDRVDVLLTRKLEKGEMINDVLLQNIRVLGIDQNASQAGNEPSVARAVTLEVTTSQSQKLALAQQVGSLALSLRNISNIVAVATKTMRIRDLKGGEANKPKVAKPVRRISATRRAPRIKRVSNVNVVRAMHTTNYEVMHEPWKSNPAAPAQNRTKTSSPIVSSVPNFKGPANTGPLNLLPGGVTSEQTVTGGADRGVQGYAQ